MKWLILFVLVASVIPASGWLRHNPKAYLIGWVVVGFLPFGVGTFHLYMAVISWAGWPGYVPGAEVTFLDILVVILYLALPKRRGTIPFRLALSLYILAVLLSALQTQLPTAALFYAWQLARIFVVYAVVAKAAADETVVRAILTGMALGLVMEVGVSIWQRFVEGILQAGGTLGHQNFLGLMSHFVFFPWIALLLAGERGWQPVVAPLSGLITAALTVSRGTVGLIGAGVTIIFGLSAWRKWTPQKAKVLAFGLALICICAPIIISAFEKRFTNDTSDTYDERAAFEKAASLMIADHPLGVGANNYVVEANTMGYNNRAGVAAVIGSDSANVHNVYYLVTAETGYAGLTTFIFVLLGPLTLAFRCGWKYRHDRRGDLLLGIGVALLMVYIQSYFEWIFITFAAQYMFALASGMTVGLAQQLGYWRSTKPAVKLNAARPPLAAANDLKS